ncbi:MAG TPA: transglutaminase family protein [Solirubrobacter sp.]|nr:transglutaminase family protein [Solirubrobacter sp.]
MEGFTRLASGECPPIADLMLALAAEFHAVDEAAADARLDALALPLFGLASDHPRTAAARLAEVIDTFHADRMSVAGLWLDRALETRSGHPLMLAALIAEVGRRAGLAVQVFSAPTGWFAGLAAEGRLWLVDATLGDNTADPWTLRRHCTHELAFAALLGLSDRFQRVGDAGGSAKAALLRARLPLKTT